jgi:hypothetical protein
MLTLPFKAAKRTRARASSLVAYDATEGTRWPISDPESTTCATHDAHDVLNHLALPVQDCCRFSQLASRGALVFRSSILCSKAHVIGLVASSLHDEPGARTIWDFQGFTSTAIASACYESH